MKFTLVTYLEYHAFQVSDQEVLLEAIENISRITAQNELIQSNQPYFHVTNQDNFGEINTYS